MNNVPMLNTRWLIPLRYADRAWRIPLALLVLGALGCQSNDATIGAPPTISFVAGTGQWATAGTAVAFAPVARVQDAQGNAVSGVRVRFTIAGGGGMVLGDSSLTDADGRATPGQWFLGIRPGTSTLRATVANTTSSATITAAAVAGSVSLHASGPQDLVALEGQPVTPPPSVELRDSLDNPVAGVTVTFTVAQGGGSIAGALATTTTTNSSGSAQVASWTLGSVAGVNLLTASTASGTTLTFTALGLTSAPMLGAASPTTQAGYLSFPVTSVPRVRVTDATGHALSSVPVTFTVTSGDATVSGGVALSDASGIAALGDWRMGLLSASTVTAATGLGAAPVVFNATGVPASFLIDLRFLTGMTPDVRDAFVAAARRWMRIITDHLTFVTVDLPAGACSPAQPAMSEGVTDIVILAEVTPIDGVGGILGSAGPCVTRSSSDLTVVGSMQFDSADLPALVSTNQLVAAITHEMAHVLGFGALWPDFSLANDLGSNDPIFIGPEAVALWPPFAGALNYTGRPVPLEACCGEGVRDVHWRESVFQAELMTGFLEPPGVPTPLSKMTIATMKDLGYQVDFTQADLFVGHLMAAQNSGAAAARINERLGHATWQVTASGEMRRIP